MKKYGRSLNDLFAAYAKLLKMSKFRHNEYMQNE